MIDVSSIVSDMFVAQSFQVIRSTGGIQALGGYQDTKTTIPMFGAVQQVQDSELRQTPQGDRITGTLLIHTTQPIYETSPTGVSDIVVWKGLQWRVESVSDRSDYGFYRAVCSRTLGE